MKNFILTMTLFSLVFLQSCTNEEATGTDEFFSLKTVKDNLFTSNESHRQPDCWSTFNGDLENPDCYGPASDCLCPVVLTNVFSQARVSQNSYINQEVLIEVDKGLISRKDVSNINQNTDYVIFEDTAGEKLVYRFQKD